MFRFDEELLQLYFSYCISWGPTMALGVVALFWVITQVQAWRNRRK